MSMVAPQRERVVEAAPSSLRLRRQQPLEPTTRRSPQVVVASGAAASSGTKVVRSTALRAVRAEGSIERSSEGKSGRPLQRRLPTRQVTRKALFVLPSSQQKSYSDPGRPLSLRLPKENRLRGRPASSAFPSAKKHAERHGHQSSSRMPLGECLVSKVQSSRDRGLRKILR